MLVFSYLLCVLNVLWLNFVLVQTFSKKFKFYFFCLKFIYHNLKQVNTKWNRIYMAVNIHPISELNWFNCIVMWYNGMLKKWIKILWKVLFNTLIILRQKSLLIRGMGQCKLSVAWSKGDFEFPKNMALSMNSCQEFNFSKDSIGTKNCKMVDCSEIHVVPYSFISLPFWSCL